MKNFFLLLLVLAFTSCSVALQTPSSRMLSPEAVGKSLSGQLSGGLIGQAKITKEIDTGTLDDPLMVERSYSIDYSAELGIVEQLDVYVGLPIFSTPIIGLKYQVYGKPRETAQEGDISVSIALGGGSNSGKDIDDDVFDLSGNTKVKDFGSNAVEATILVGKRTKKDVLAFGFVTLTQWRFFGDVSSNNVAIDGVYFEEEGTTTTAGVGLMRYYDKYTLRIEAVGQRVDFENTNDTLTLGFAQFSLGYFFN